jgi:hypothetical protein
MNNDEHKSEEQLSRELAEAAKLVPVGSYYVHYKHPDWEHRYRVMGYAILEATDEVAILYQPMYMTGPIQFARAMHIWLETVEWEGKTVPRFALIADKP